MHHPSAFNYNPEAEYDNGSCIAVEEGALTSRRATLTMRQTRTTEHVCIWMPLASAAVLARPMQTDSICDDVDPCVGELDACGVCNGPGEIYECGCADIPEATVIVTETSSRMWACEAATASRPKTAPVVTAASSTMRLGECGGPCEACGRCGIDNDVDPCVGGARRLWLVQRTRNEIYACGCSDIPPVMHCDGNSLDALGECGGPCE